MKRRKPLQVAVWVFLVGGVFGFRSGHAAQPEIELLINETTSIDEITPHTALPKEPINITVNRINGQLLRNKDVSINWHCPVGAFRSLDDHQVSWTAPTQHGVFPIDLVIQWRERTITRRITVLVMIPMENHLKGKPFLASQKESNSKVSRAIKDQFDDEGEMEGAPMMMGLGGFQSLKYYAETLPARISKVKPKSNLYAKREYYLKIPTGLIEVTPQNEEIYLTPHLQIKDFKCKGDKGYPQYICLNPSLLMKLEAIQDELKYLDIPCDRLTILSGYRNPPYNKRIGNVKFSRHTYGDAADFYVDQDHNGLMDDLNRDGKITVKDAEMLRSIIERVEDFGAPHGGIGVYPPKRKWGRGPFVHVDTRGFRARW